MDAIAAVICEYNPLHNGHAYHLEQTRKACACDGILCLMSGNFVQRGEAAILPKHERASAAIVGGADLVIELPVTAACSPAQDFAKGAIRILNAMPSVRYLSFGIESAKLDDLKRIAQLFTDETESFSRTVRAILKTGVSYPRAKAEAVKTLYGDLGRMLDYANNILAVEYLCALMTTGSTLIPVSVDRQGDLHRSSSPNTELASATAVRKLISQGQDATRYLPEYVSVSAATAPDATRETLYQILRPYFLNTRPEELAQIPDVREGLEFTIKKAASECVLYNAFLKRVKSKRFTRAMIDRTLIRAALGITKDDRDRSSGRFILNPLAYRENVSPNQGPNTLLTCEDYEALLGKPERPDADLIVKADRLYDVLTMRPHSDGKSFFTKKVYP